MPLNRLFLYALILIFGSGMAQQTSLEQGKIYTLGNIEVTGLKTFSSQTVIAYTGLRTGEQIQIPGEEISAVINKLWKLELFSDINFYLTNIDGDVADIEIYIQELPTLSSICLRFSSKCIFQMTFSFRSF